VTKERKKTIEVENKSHLAPRRGKKSETIGDKKNKLLRTHIMGVKKVGTYGQFVA